jgi:hypothetical protein
VPAAATVDCPATFGTGNIAEAERTTMVTVSPVLALTPPAGSWERTLFGAAPLVLVVVKSTR